MVYVPGKSKTAAAIFLRAKGIPSETRRGSAHDFRSARVAQMTQAKFHRIHLRLARELVHEALDGVHVHIRTQRAQCRQPPVDAADRLVFVTQPGGVSRTGSPLATQPVLETEDPFGNFSTVGLPANLNVTMALTAGSGTLLGTTTLDIGTAAGDGTVA